VNVAAELEALGVDLVVLDQSIDTSTPAGRFLFNTLSAVAELERDLIRERVVAGMAAARRRGKHLPAGARLREARAAPPPARRRPLAACHRGPARDRPGHRGARSRAGPARD
jgi:DNA invertase Pin-like site-specific DNA recombinase